MHLFLADGPKGIARSNRQAIDSFGESVFVAKTLEGSVVGYGLGIKEPYGDNGWILSIGVHPEYRKLGIGSRFLEQFVSLFKRLGARSLLATADPENAASLALCRRFGFEEHFSEDDYFGPGLPQIRLELRL